MASWKRSLMKWRPKRQNSNMKRLLSGIFVFFATLVVLFEEWLWFRLLKVMQLIIKLPIFKQIDGWVRHQNEFVSLALFVIPELAFIPVKMGVFWLIGNNHAYSGIVLFIAAKITGTALFAWMYNATEQKIKRFAFVRWVIEKVMWIREMAHVWLNSQPMYVETREKVKSFIHHFKSAKQHPFHRRFKAALQIARNR